MWAVWSYAKSHENIAAWREHIPLGRRRGAHFDIPPRIEGGDPSETIEHIRVSLLKFFDLAEIVARAQGNPANVTDEELHNARAVDLLLFDLFGEDGMLLPAAAYAAPLAATVRQALEALAPLAPHDPDAARICQVLSVLAPFYADYHPWAEALRFWPVSPRDTFERWRSLLEDVRNTARRLRRAKSLAGDLHAVWQTAAELLENRQQFLRLQMAMRVAVERDDPTCRHLCASRPLLAQLDAERRRPGQASPFPRPLRGSDLRRQAGRPPASDCQSSRCPGLPAVARHRGGRRLPDAAPVACRAFDGRSPQIDSRVRRADWATAASCGQRSTPCADMRRDEDLPMVEAACAAAATARDLSDGFYVVKRRKGLRTLLAMRRGDFLDDLLVRT